MNLMQFDQNPDSFLIGQNFHKLYMKNMLEETQENVRVVRDNCIARQQKVLYNQCKVKSAWYCVDKQIDRAAYQARIQSQNI